LLNEHRLLSQLARFSLANRGTIARADKRVLQPDPRN
jgi:hypothetical protein